MTRLIAIVFFIGFGICAVSLPDKRKTAKMGSDCYR